jgi:hypothetical protein
MAEILNYPSYLLTRHTNWHMNAGRPDLGGRAIKPPNKGSGQEFLDFHHQFLIDFHLWYDTQPGADLAIVAPWSAIPAEMKSVVWFGVDINAFEAQVNDPNAFADEDALGLFIEPVHNTGHGIMASVYSDALVGPIDKSPRSSHFYNWHGLIDHWRHNWLNKLRELVHVPPNVKELMDGMSSKTIVDTISISPKAIKDLSDVMVPPRIGLGPDPMSQVQQLARRVSELEMRVEGGKPFIQQSERPKVK